ncbi:MAG: hypothetical protein D6767_00300 [Candidatus Hydrogenedentota bacterium]|nr:MAG: hypothetical protein D6767_00300 [Candidatus Hydrogenedentota bacterium]
MIWKESLKTTVKSALLGVSPRSAAIKIILVLFLAPVFSISKSKFGLEINTWEKQADGWAYRMQDSLTLKKARFFEKKKNDFEMITELKRLLYHDFPRPILHFAIAKAYARSHNFYEAYSHWKKIGKEYPSFPDEVQYAYFLSGFDFQEHLGKVQWKQVETYYKKLNQQNSKHAENFRLRSGLYLLSQGNVSSAKFLIQGLTGYDQVKNKFVKPQPVSKWNLLWGIVPGGVFFRFGKWKRGFMSFTTVGALGAITVFSAIQGGVILPLLAGAFAIRYFFDSLSQSFLFLVGQDKANIKQWRKELYEAANLPTDRPFYSGFRFRIVAIP